MIEVVTELNGHNFIERVNDLIAKGYEIKGAEVAKNNINAADYPFIYTALLIKQ